MSFAKRTLMRMREMRPNSVATSPVTVRSLKPSRPPANPMVASAMLLRPGSGSAAIFPKLPELLGKPEA